MEETMAFDITPSAGSGSAEGLTLSWPAGAVTSTVTVTISKVNAVAETGHTVCLRDASGQDKAWRMEVKDSAGAKVVVNLNALILMTATKA
jgi:hypothetical protein